MKRSHPNLDIVEAQPKRRVVVVTKTAPRGRTVNSVIEAQRNIIELPDEMWDLIMGRLTSADAIIAIARTCKLLAKSASVIWSELLKRVRCFVSSWATLTEGGKQKVLGTPLDYFWGDHFNGAGRWGCKLFMDWLPNPTHFDTVYDTHVCESALQAGNFTFLDWAMEQGYRMYFAHMYQKYHYYLFDGKVKDQDAVRAAKILGWLKDNQNNYTMDIRGREGISFNPLNVGLKFVLFHPIGKRWESTSVPRFRPYWKRC
jgi:hypothetical protein